MIFRTRIAEELGSGLIRTDEVECVVTGLDDAREKGAQAAELMKGFTEGFIEMWNDLEDAG